MKLTRNTQRSRFGWRAAAGCLLAALLSSCAQVYTVKVDALRASYAAPRRTYRIEELKTDPGANEAHRRLAREVVEGALAARGLFAASCPEWADLVIAIECTIGPRHLKATADASDELASASSVFVPQSDGATIGDATGFVMETSVMKRLVAVREKKLALTARENLLGVDSAATAGTELWRVEVSLEDESESLSDLLPVLGSALVDHIDENFGAARQISERDSQALLISAHP